MKALWDWLTDDKNHRALQLILTLVTGVVVGAWTLYANLLKPPATPAPPPLTALAVPPPLPPESLSLLSDAKARLVTQANEVLYFEDASGAFSVDHALLLRENKITTAAQARQFSEVLESDLRQCSESAAARPGLAEKLAARTECLDRKGYSANTQHYLRARHGLVS